MLRLTHEPRRPAARPRGVTRGPVTTAFHPVLRLQQSAGNHAVAAMLARAATVGFAPVEITAKRNVSHEQRLREEIAGALGVPPDDPRVEVALFGDLEVARALKDARRMDEEAKASTTPKPEQAQIREDPYKGLTLEQRERRMREDALKKELANRGITDEMILKGYRKETRVQLGPKARGLLVDQWIPEGGDGRYVHTYEFENEGKTTRVVATTDFAKGGEKTTVRTTIEGGRETTVTTMEPGYGKRGERAALEQTSTRWVVNPDGSVTVETLDKYGRPIPGRSWKPDVLKLR